MPVENIVNGEEWFKSYNLFRNVIQTKISYVIYDNHQGVTHILETPVCIIISLSQHSVKYNLWYKKYEFVSLHTNLYSIYYSKA